MKKVVFICVHNSCRSQVAEALGRRFAGDAFEGYPAGTETKPQINQDAVHLMKEIYGIDMEAEGAATAKLDLRHSRVPGTSIYYPVVMGGDQDPGFYLFHDVEGIYSPWGTPYVAYGCEQGLDSPLVNRSDGHHMSDGTMFAVLREL